MMGRGGRGILAAIGLCGLVTACSPGAEEDAGGSTASGSTGSESEDAGASSSSSQTESGEESSDGSSRDGAGEPGEPGRSGGESPSESTQEQSGEGSDDASGGTEESPAGGTSGGQGRAGDENPREDAAVTQRRVPEGEKPPQFVVMSWDGAGETPREKGVSRFRKAGDESDANMTFFLSGPFLATGQQVNKLYDPPNHPKGMQHIKPRTEQMVVDTTRELAAAYETGHEIGTHYNGHFCGPGGGNDWSVAQWHQEMDEWYELVERWEGKTPIEGGTALPKGLARSVEGGRTPCLEGVQNAQKAAAEDGWTYDSSSLDVVRWPAKDNGLWNIPMPTLTVPELDDRMIPAMDYNWFSAFNTWAPDMPNQERGRVMQETYDAELEKALDGNRAPLILGNHLAAWDDGVYLDAMDRFTREQCPREEVHCVSFEQLVDFLDAQDPDQLAAWREVPPGSPGRW
ncbi:polysaccharide deacetylase family protein [Kytococcus sp. Marseille-QA3725]